jgi:two-component system sensor histidine kinase/response regulator
MKIRTKISLAFLVTAVALTSVSASVFYTMSRDNLTEAISAHLVTTAQSRAHHIESVLDKKLETLRLVSSRTQLRLSLEDYGKKRNIEDKAKMARILRDAKSSVSGLGDIFIMDLGGEVIVSTDETLDGKNYSGEIFFIQGEKGDNLFLLPVEDNDASIYLSGPLLLENKLLGVLVIISSADDIFSVTLDRTGLGKTGEVYLVNKDGYMITPSRFTENVLFMQKVDTRGTRRGFEDIEKFGDKEHPHEPLVYADYRGIRVLGVNDHISKTEWILLAEIDERQALAPLTKIKILFTVILIIVPLIAWLLGMLISKAITRPIESLHLGTELIGRGNLDHKVGTTAKDEIGQLSRAFDAMTDNLKKTTASRDELAREVEERIKLERSLQESEEKFRQFFENDPNYCYMISSEGKIMDVNKSALKVLGYTSEELIGKPVAGIVYAPSSREKAKELLMKWKKTGKVRNEEMDIITKIGEERTVLLNVDAARDFEGKILHSISVQSDITERKKLDKLKDEFVNTVSHELRSPLAIIKQHIYSIRHKMDENVDDEQKHFIDSTEKNVDRLSHLINNILDYQKLSAEKMVFEAAGGDINKLVEEIEKEMSPLAENKKITLSIHPAKDLPKIRFDSDRITQVLLNLIDNAIKFTEKGNVAVTTSKTRDGVCVSVKDAGVGIKKDEIDRLFRSFSQIRAADGAKPSGSGLGLAICKKIIEQHGGKIWVESEYGKGSTFTFSLPVSA